MTTSEETAPERLSPWIWLAPAPLIVVLQVGAKAISEDFYAGWLRGEKGLVEVLTVLFLVAAVLEALRLFRLRDGVAWPHFGKFALLMAAGCAFFAGEEASWGQHWLGFAPPEAIAARNEQGEFNLHNDPLLETVLDQLPRNLLTLAALVGGVIAPLFMRQRTSSDFKSDSPWSWIWPTKVALPSALVAVTITLPEKLFEATREGVPYLLEISAGETKELSIALFLLVYLASLRRRLAPQSPQT